MPCLHQPRLQPPLPDGLSRPLAYWWTALYWCQCRLAAGWGLWRLLPCPRLKLDLSSHCLRTMSLPGHWRQPRPCSLRRRSGSPVAQCRRRRLLRWCYAHPPTPCCTQSVADAILQHAAAGLPRRTRPAHRCLPPSRLLHRPLLRRPLLAGGPGGWTAQPRRQWAPPLLQPPAAPASSTRHTVMFAQLISRVQALPGRGGPELDVFH